MNGNKKAVPWHWIVLKRRGNKQSFLLYIFQYNRLHDVAAMQGLTFRDSVVILFNSARWNVLLSIEFLIARQAYIGNVMCESKIGELNYLQPCESPCDVWVTVALNCKSVIYWLVIKTRCE